MPTIYPVELPEHHTDRLWAACRGLAREYNRELISGPQWDISDEEALANAKADPEHRFVRFIAYEDRQPVGYASYHSNTVDDPDTAVLHSYVTPRYRGRGIGAALVQRLDETLAETPFTRQVAWVLAPMLPGPTLSPPSGSGAVPADFPGIQMALGRGFALAQVEQVSRYDFALPAVDPATAYAQAAAVAGGDYEAISWEGPAAVGLLAGIAHLKQRMSTDVPAGDLSVRETSWDAQRVRRAEESALATMRLWRTVARHRPTGQVVALTELTHSRSNPSAFLEQLDTIVLPEHRGHRLGMLTKAANLLQVRDALSTPASIVTWNAAENHHMLAVNEELGFRRILLEAAFQKHISKAPPHDRAASGMG